MAILLLTVAAVLLLVACNHAEGVGGTGADDNVCNDVESGYDMSDEIPDDQEVVEAIPEPFPYGDFPEEIIFTTEFGVYPSNVGTIVVTLTNSATEPSTLEFGYRFRVLRQEGDGWVSSLPSGSGGSVQLPRIAMGSGGMHSYMIANSDYLGYVNLEKNQTINCFGR